MKYLLRNLNTLITGISAKGRVVLFLDYDGTLSPIVKDPRKAALSLKARKILTKLVQDKHFILSVVSGRQLKQVKRLAGIKGIYYAGCHGLEIDKKGRMPLLSDFSAMRNSKPLIENRLKRALSGIKGWGIEDKGIVLTLHYRNVKPGDTAKLRKIFHGITSAYVKKGDVITAKGKKVLEVKPAKRWDKGRYCLHFINNLKGGFSNALCIYIGDDVTDESAFKALKNRGMTVFVKGEKKTSSAKYYLNSTDEVLNFLNCLAGLFK